jgi:hypothetical protein
MPKDKTSTEVAVVEDTLPAGMTQEELDALLASQEDEMADDGSISTPIIKIGQGLTREVQEGEAEAGEFIDSLAGEGLGTKIDFIVAYYQTGRFAADRDTGKAYVAFGPTIPANWADLVGEEWVGTAFDEHPDAEEKYKERVNAKEIEWGKGPKISTTHNFTGFALIPSVDPDEPDEMRPARLSLQRTNMKAVRDWKSFKKTRLRNKPFWDLVFNLSTAQNKYLRGVAYNLVVKPGRATDAEERMAAAELARAVAAGRVRDNSATSADESAPAPADNGGLAV